MSSHSLADVCKYLKGFVIPNTPDNFTVAGPFRHGLTNDELIAGIDAFRNFVYSVFDKLAAEQDKYGKKKLKSGHYLRWFPFVHDILSLLFFIGLHGKLETEPKKELVVAGPDLLVVPKQRCSLHGTLDALKLEKMSATRITELFEFLSEMGFFFEELNLSEKVDLAKTGTFYVSNENDGDIIVGLKLIVEATENIDDSKYTCHNIANLMRCESYPLASAVPVQPRGLELDDFTRAQPPEVKDWLARLDKFLLDNSCKMEVKNETSYTYVSKKTKKRMCAITSEIECIFIQPSCYHSHATKSTPVVLTENMLNILRNVHCIGCRAVCLYGGPFTFTHNGEDFAACRAIEAGYKFTLDNADERDVIWKWIEAELKM